MQCRRAREKVPTNHRVVSHWASLSGGATKAHEQMKRQPGHEGQDAVGISECKVGEPQRTAFLQAGKLNLMTNISHQFRAGG